MDYEIKKKPEDFIVNEITNINLLEKGEYSIYLLKKKNYNTEDAVYTISHKLKLPRKFIGYAGNKDKIAITTQYISIKNSNVKNLELKDISIEFVGYLDKPVSLGDLNGNEFIIKVYTSGVPKKLNKIINYYGEQRFSKNNKDIGYAILKKDFKKAIEVILEYNGGYEKTVKKYLSIKPNDYIGALRKMPLKILKLYVHSYQSYLWNNLAQEKSKAVVENIDIPIIGFSTKPDETINNILKKEGLVLRDFIVRSIPELTVEGYKRDLYTKILDFKIEKNDNGYTLHFKLNKGCYATEVIKQIFD
jgi:tRNA pseudouridine13 synthase